MSEDRTTSGASPTEHARPPDATSGAGGSHPLAVSPGPDERAAEERTAAGRPADAEPPPPAAAETSAGSHPTTGSPRTTVLPAAGGRPTRPGPRPDRAPAEGRPAPRAQGRPGRRRARLVVQRVDAWSVFLFSLVASLCLGVVLLVAVLALYAVLSSLGVIASLNGVLGEVVGTGAADEVIEPFITLGRVLGGTAVLAAVDVVLLTALATLGALLYNLCASLTGGIEVQLGERE